MKKINVFLLLSFMITNVLVAQDIGYEDIQPQLNSMANISAFYEVNDIVYYKGVINDPVKALKYEGDKKVAANLGVYMADMIYGIGAKSFDGNESFGAVMELSRKLGMEDQFTQLVITRLNAKDLKATEAANILDEVISGSEKKLNSEEKSEIYDFMLYGNYIEKLYLISSVLEKSKGSDLPASAQANLNRSLLLLMARQGEPLEELSKLMIDHSSNIVAHRDIQKLLEYYAALKEQAPEIVKLEPAEIYNAKEIKNIQKQIGEIRERIVK